MYILCINKYNYIYNLEYKINLLYLYFIVLTYMDTTLIEPP